LTDIGAGLVKEASKTLLKTQRLQQEVSSKIRKRGVAFTDDEDDDDENAVEDAVNNN
jgi:hypothetical protein